jgi:hypothetical protein
MRALQQPESGDCNDDDDADVEAVTLKLVPIQEGGYMGKGNGRVTQMSEVYVPADHPVTKVDLDPHLCSAFIFCRTAVVIVVVVWVKVSGIVRVVLSFLTSSLCGAAALQRSCAWFS